MKFTERLELEEQTQEEMWFHIKGPCETEACLDVHIGLPLPLEPVLPTRLLEAPSLSVVLTQLFVGLRS